MLRELLGFVLLLISVVNQLSGVQQGQAALALCENLANKQQRTEKERQSKGQQDFSFWSTIKTIRF